MCQTAGSRIHVTHESYAQSPRHLALRSRVLGSSDDRRLYAENSAHPELGDVDAIFKVFLLLYYQYHPMMPKYVVFEFRTKHVLLAAYTGGL